MIGFTNFERFSNFWELNNEANKTGRIKMYFLGDILWNFEAI